jgi:hypothetical protein
MKTTASTQTTSRSRRLIALAAAALAATAVLSLAKPASATTYPGGTYAGGGANGGTLEQAPPNYGAPTPNLEALARNTSTNAKGVNAAVYFARNATTANVTLSVAFGGSPASSQTYSNANGNRFSTVFPIGNGAARWENITITMVERQGTKSTTFTSTRSVNIRPLWDVSISPIKMTMLNDCDTWIQGSAGEVDFNFATSAAWGTVSFTLGNGESRWINEFAANWTEVGVTSDLRVPKVWWDENDWDKPDVWGDSTTTDERILPGNTRNFNWTEAEYGGDCSARFSYTINVTPRYYPV